MDKIYKRKEDNQLLTHGWTDAASHAWSRILQLYAQDSACTIRYTADQWKERAWITDICTRDTADDPKIQAYKARVIGRRIHTSISCDCSVRGDSSVDRWMQRDGRGAIPKSVPKHATGVRNSSLCTDVVATLQDCCQKVSEGDVWEILILCHRR